MGKKVMLKPTTTRTKLTRPNFSLSIRPVIFGYQ